MEENKYGIKKIDNWAFDNIKFINNINTYQYNNIILMYRVINYTKFGIIIKKKYGKE